MSTASQFLLVDRKDYESKITELHFFLRNLRKEQEHEQDKITCLNKLLKELNPHQINASSELLRHENALQIALEGELILSAKTLIEAGVSISGIPSTGFLPLHEACRIGDLDLVTLILVKGADIQAVDGEGLHPLHHASQNDHTRIIELLLDFAKESEIIDLATSDSQKTALHFAAENGHVQSINVLMKRGARGDIYDKNTCTPLMAATKRGDTPIIEILLKRGGPQLEIADEEGFTPLLKAISDQSPSIAKTLLEAGANHNASTKKGQSCLHWNLWRFSREIFDMIMEKEHLEIDAQDSEGKTALHYVCGAWNEELQESCTAVDEIDGGANDERSREERRLNILKRLLEKKPNANIETKKSEMALEFALKFRGQNSIDTLLRYVSLEECVAFFLSERFLPIIERREKSPKGNRILRSLLQACQNPEVFDRTLIWSAMSPNTHWIAAELFAKYNEIDQTESLVGLSVIEHAAYRKKSEALWWLIATSLYNFETTDRVRLALERLHAQAKETGERRTEGRRTEGLVRDTYFTAETYGPRVEKTPEDLGQFRGGYTPYG